MDMVHRSVLIKVFCFFLNMYLLQSERIERMWMSVTWCHLNAVCRHSEVPSMYGAEEYILFLLRDSSHSLLPEPLFGIVNIQSG